MPEELGRSRIFEMRVEVVSNFAGDWSFAIECWVTDYYFVLLRRFL